MVDESTPGYHELRQHLMDNPERGLWERMTDPAVEWLADRNIPVLSEWADNVAMSRSYLHEAEAHYEAVARIEQVQDAPLTPDQQLGIHTLVDAMNAPTIQKADEIMGGRISAALAETARPPWVPDQDYVQQTAWDRKHHANENPLPPTTPQQMAQGELPGVDPAQAKLIASGQEMQARLSDGTAFQSQGQGQENDISR